VRKPHFTKQERRQNRKARRSQFFGGAGDTIRRLRDSRPWIITVTGPAGSQIVSYPSSVSETCSFTPDLEGTYVVDVRRRP